MTMRIDDDNDMGASMACWQLERVTSAHVRDSGGILARITVHHAQ
jgi:hypothetical protein